MSDIMIIEAIKKLDKTAHVSVNAEDYDQIIWHDGNPNNITKEQIKTKLIELQTAFDAQSYARNRAEEYPSWQEQMDMIYWDGVNGTTTHHDSIKAIKDKYSKS